MISVSWHLLFLCALGVCVGVLLFQWHRGKKQRYFIGLNVFFAVALLALLAYQACWQISGMGSLPFQKFRRRYDRRPATVAENSLTRGRLLDCQGRVLASSAEGQRWGHKTLLGPAGVHVIGYASQAYGLSGMERVFDTRLCGFSEGVEKPEDLVQRQVPKDVQLTLDADLQKAAFNALKGRTGAVVILDPTTGAIRALVSSPACEESELVAAMKDTTHAPLFNRATQGLYPPGSTFKIFTAANALLTGKAQTYFCPSRGWSPNNYTAPIRDSHPMTPPETPLRRAFAQSSNIYFAKAAIATGWPTLNAFAEASRLTQKLTLAKCGERTYETARPRFPDLSKQPMGLAYLGFGQGELRLTPLHVALLTSTIATGGVYHAPYLVAGEQVAGVRVWPKSIAGQVRDLMRASVTEGTSRAVALPNLTICGKTGTAETSGRDHAWFTCFAPAENPKIVITVLVEHGGFGAATALPIARELLQQYFKSR